MVIIVNKTFFFLIKIKEIRKQNNYLLEYKLHNNLKHHCSLGKKQKIK